MHIWYWYYILWIEMHFDTNMMQLGIRDDAILMRYIFDWIYSWSISKAAITRPNHMGVLKLNPSVPCLSLGREGARLSSNAAHRDGTSHLWYILHGCGNNKVKKHSTYEVIAEARVRWKYILLSSSFLMFLSSESILRDCFRMANQTF